MKEEDVSFWIQSLETLKNILGSQLFTGFVIVCFIILLYYAKVKIDQLTSKKDDKEDSPASTQFQDTKAISNNNQSSVSNSGNIAINVTPNGSKETSEHSEIVDGLELASNLTLKNVDLSDKIHEAKQKHIDELVKNANLTSEIRNYKSNLKNIHRILTTFFVRDHTRRENDGYIREIIDIIEENMPELKVERLKKEKAVKELNTMATSNNVGRSDIYES